MKTRSQAKAQWALKNKLFKLYQEKGLFEYLQEACQEPRILRENDESNDVLSIGSNTGEASCLATWPQNNDLSIGFPNKGEKDKPAAQTGRQKKKRKVTD